MEMIQILKAYEKDNIFLAKVCRDAVQLYEKITPGSFQKQAVRFEREGLPSSYEVSIVYYENHPIGFIGSTTLTPNITYVVALYLLNEYQRKGLGTKILNIFLSSLYQNGKKEVALLVHKNASWAIDFYRKNGFEVITDEERRIKQYADSSMNKFYLPNTLLMSKCLLSSVDKEFGIGVI
jgi:ribosomal protein S18 acetylase RimI-like enzyme